MLIGGFLFGDKSSSRVKLMFLPLLGDLHAANTFSWGSAALLWLYREMCLVTKRDAKDISGPLILLQLWAWERLVHIVPQRVLPRQRVALDGAAPDGAGAALHGVGVAAVDVGPAHDAVDAHSAHDGPLGCRWDVTFLEQHTPTHVLCHYRDQLDQMSDNQMIWKPYSADVMGGLPDYCLIGQDIWCTRAPLICFDVVKWHFSD